MYAAASMQAGTNTEVCLGDVCGLRMYDDVVGDGDEMVRVCQNRNGSSSSHVSQRKPA